MIYLRSSAVDATTNTVSLQLADEFGKTVTVTGEAADAVLAALRQSDVDARQAALRVVWAQGRPVAGEW